MKPRLESEQRKENTAEHELAWGAIPIARVADNQDLAGPDEEHEYVLDEIVLDEEEFIWDQGNSQTETDVCTAESSAVVEPLTDPRRVTTIQSVQPESSQLKPPSPVWPFQWRGFLVGIGLVFFLQWMWTMIRTNQRSKPATIAEDSANKTDFEQSLEYLKSLPFGAQKAQDCEPVEWVNMCWRKAWRVYQRGLERWFSGLLQNLFDSLVDKGKVPTFVQRLRVLELTFDHEAPCFSNMRRRPSRKDSDLNGVVDVRYTGDARMLLMLEVGGGEWRLQVPVLVSDLDIECRLWVKIRLAPLAPFLGTVSLACVGPPNIKVQLSSYNSVRLMRVPVLQNFLNRFLTEDLPGLMVLPKRLEINIPPAVTAVAEAAVGRDAVMKAVASAVLQADVVEQSLTSALPLGPQGAAGGISVPDSFQGELSVTLVGGRNLPVWGFPWQSNPYCRLTLGKQAVTSKRESDTSCEGSHQNPIWNQEFEFLVEDTDRQVLEIYIKDSHLTGRPEVGKVEFSLKRGVSDKTLDVWLPVQSVNPGQTSSGELRLELTYKLFLDDEEDSGFREAEAYARENGGITDVKSAAAASSKAGVAASAAFAAVAMTKAAAARAAHKAQQAAKAAKNIASLGSMDNSDYDELAEAENFDSDSYDDDSDLDQSREEDDPEYENEMDAVRSRFVSADDYEELESEKMFEPAIDLEGSELEDVLAKVKANLGENIASVVGLEELASQLSILRTQKSNETAADKETLPAAKVKDIDDYQSIQDNLNGLMDDNAESMQLGSQVREDGHQDGSNFDMPGLVPPFDDNGVDTAQSPATPGAGVPFVFRAGELVTEVEPAEAFPTPFLHDSEEVHIGSYTKSTEEHVELDVPASNLLEDVAATVTALESKLPQYPPYRKLSHQQADTQHENAAVGSQLKKLGKQGSSLMNDSDKLSVDKSFKKRKKGGETSDGLKNQWITNLWKRVRRKQDQVGSESMAETMSANPPFAGTEASNSPETSPAVEDKTPWWAILTAARLLRGQPESVDEVATEKNPVKPNKPAKKKRKGSGPRLDVPPIDMAAIARELANMRKEKASVKDKELEGLQNLVPENADRQWIIFLCFLTACSAALLTVVAYRLEHF